MESICDVLHGLKPVMLMVVVQCAFAAVNVFYKLAANDGMSLRIIVAYRFMFASAFVVPLALIFERKGRPKLTWGVLFQAFLCGLFGGTLAQNFYIESLALTSATFASAMFNLIPAVTFILAVLFRLERLNLGTAGGKCKVLGTSIGIGGALLLAFYKGAEINLWSTQVNLLHDGQHQGGHLPSSLGENRLLGCFFSLGSCFSYALWLIIQAKMSQKYPCHFSSSALTCVMGAIQSSVFALCMDRDWSQWKLGWDIRLLTVSYSGIVASGLMLIFIAWCVHLRGPLFVSVFNPLMLILVAIAGSLLLDEKLHLGSILGAALIVCGLYLVLWGKGKEMKKITQLAPSNFCQESELSDIVIASPPEANNNNNNNNVTASAKPDCLPTSNAPVEGSQVTKERGEKEENGVESSRFFKITFCLSH